MVKNEVYNYLTNSSHENGWWACDGVMKGEIGNDLKVVSLFLAILIH